LQKEYLESMGFIGKFIKNLSLQFREMKSGRKIQAVKKSKTPVTVKVLTAETPKAVVAEKSPRFVISRELGNKLITYFLIASILIVLAIGIFLSYKR
jgi:hypothetical protein